ncbi:MAG: FG-GAP-like repeat-containing protein [Chitinophagaceae bacterium]
MNHFYPLLKHAIGRSMHVYLFTLSFLALSFPVFAQPVITSFSPTSGAVGTTVTISGSNFSSTPAGNTVYFGAVKAVVSSATSTSLTVTVPAGSTYQPITVTTGNLTASSANPFIVTFTGGEPLAASSYTDSLKLFDLTPSGSAVTDFDVDGKPDIVAINWQLEEFWVFRNTSTTSLSFAPYVNYRVWWEALSQIRIADVDGDGKPDIIIWGNSLVAIFRNVSTPGTIAFEQQVEYYPGNVNRFDIGDLDQDGRPDIALTLQGSSNKFCILKNNSTPGTVSFGTAVNFNIGSKELYDIKIADLNNDGKQDIITGARQGGISAFRNMGTTGSFAFAANVDLTAGGNNARVVIGDLDLDNKPDLIVTNTTTNTISVLKNNSYSDVISFAEAQAYATGNNPVDIAVADIDGDGKPDVLVSAQDAAAVTFLHNNSLPGTIDMSSRLDFATPGRPGALAVCDFDNNGTPDIAVTDSTKHTIVIFKRTKSGLPEITGVAPAAAYSGDTVTISGNNFVNITAVQFGGVAAASFVLVSQNTIKAIVGNGANGNVSVQNNTGTATRAGFVYKQPPVVTGFAPSSGPAGTTIMITGSGFSTTVSENIVFIGGVKATVTAATSGYLTVIVPAGASYTPLTVTTDGHTGYASSAFIVTGANNGILRPSSFVKASDIPLLEPQPFHSDMITYDLNADGKQDLILANKGVAFTDGYPSISIYSNTDAGGHDFSFGYRQDLATLSGTPVKVAAGDLDADGKPDLVVISNGSSISSVTIFRNITATGGAVSFAAPFEITAGAMPVNVTIADINGDGKPDVIVANKDGGTVSVFKNTGTPGSINLLPVGEFAVGASPVGLATGDLNGDNLPDIAVTNQQGNTVSVLKNTGTGGSITFAAPAMFSTGNTPGKVALVDIDRDGKQDLVVVNTNGQSFSVLRNIALGGNIAFDGKVDMPTGHAPVDFAVADLDGDNAPDITVAEQAGAQIYVGIFRNVSSGTTVNFSSITEYNFAGLATNIVACDFGGDGKPDIAISSQAPLGIFFYKNNVSQSFNINSFEPQKARSGDTVLIKGANFTGITAVSFGDSLAVSFVIKGDTAISAVVGNGASGKVRLMSATDTVSKDGFTFLTTPLITGFTPSSAASDSGVIITGHYFDSVTAVSFGGVPAKSYTVLSSEIISAIVGSGATGNVSVQNVVGTGTKAGFIFKTAGNALTITGVNPIAGAVGSVVTITGTNFSSTPANNIVYFGAVKAVVNTATGTSLTVTVPAGAGYQPITVTTNNSTVRSSLPFTVTFSGTVLSSSSFDTAMLYASMGIEDVASADFDGDGNIDIAVTNSSVEQVVSVYRHTASANTISFVEKVNLSAEDTPRKIRIADMDGDGKPDIIISCAYYLISVYRNTSTPGNLSFAPPVSFTAGFITKFDVGDLNQDGKPDIAITLQDAPYRFVIYKNTSAGTSILFDPSPTSVNTGSTPKDILIADLDGDGKQDVAVTTSGDPAQSIAAFKNNSTNGAFSFQPKVSYNTGGVVSNLIIGDFDRDNKPDLAATNANNKVVLLRNTSSPDTIGYILAAQYTVGAYPNGIAVTDVDGDGKPEVLTSAHNTNTVSVLPNTSVPGTISMNEKLEFSAGNYPGALSVGDFNLDGLPDVAVLDSSLAPPYSTITFLVGRKVAEPVISGFTPAEGYTESVITISGSNFSNITAVSFGGVAAKSFTIVSSNTITAVVGNGSSGNITVTASAGTASAAGFTFLRAPSVSSYVPQSGPVGTLVTISGNNFDNIATNNIVRFGAVEALVISGNSSSLVVEVPAGATFEPVSVTTGGLVAFANSPFKVTFPSIGHEFQDISFAEAKQFAGGNTIYQVKISDIDGDGKPDIAALDNSTVSFAGVSILRNNSSNGNISMEPRIRITTSPTPYSFTINDFNGDGKPDMAVTYDGASLSILKNTSTVGSISFAAQIDIPAVSRPYSITAADVNADGKVDLIVVNTAAHVLSVYKNTSVGDSIAFATRIDYPTGNTPYWVETGDIDGDGKPDIVVANWLSNTISVYKNTSAGNTVSFASKVDFATSYPPRCLAITDLNGDGKADIAVAVTDSYNNQVDVFKNTSSSSGISFEKQSGNQIANYNQFITIADLDGDAKPDLVTTINGYNGFTVFKNNSNAGGTISFEPGKNYVRGELPINIACGDLDGDSKPEIVVAEVYNNTVAIYRNQVAEATVMPSGNNPVNGPVISKVTVDDEVKTYNSAPYVQRHYDIEPVNNAATATATVTLYFTQQEFDNFNAFPSHGLDLPTGPDDVAGKAALRVYQYHGFSTTSLPSTYSGSAVEINPDDAKIIWNANTQWWEVTFDVNGFSGFFVSSVGNSALPVTLVSFDASAKGKDAFLQWSTSQEMNVDLFEVQRNADAKEFRKIATVSAVGNSSSTLFYDYTDTISNNKVYYYRLKMVDKDGSFTYSKVVSVRSSWSNSTLRIVPNPARGVTVISHPAYNGNAWLSITDATGRAVKAINIQRNDVQTTVSLTGLIPGVYNVLWSDGTRKLTKMLLIQ